MTLYLLKYNNYYNRIVKRYETIQEYENEDVLAAIGGVNFNPNNDIQTTQVVNYNGETPNYLIAVNDDNTIASRWFVISHTRIRSGQYNLVLYRDIIADHYDDVLNQPMFIEKATVGIGDTAIFNNENMGFNQIKQSETLLTDRSKIAWIVGYIDKNYSGGTIDIPVSQAAVSGEYSSLEAYPYYAYNASNPICLADNINSVAFRYNFYNEGITRTSATVSFGVTGENTQPHIGILQGGAHSNIWYKDKNNQDVGYKVPYGIFSSGSAKIAQCANKIFEKLQGTNWSQYSYLYADFGSAISGSSLSTILAENGKIIKVGELYYKISVNSLATQYRIATIPSNSALGYAMYDIISDNPYIDFDTKKEPVYQYEVGVIPYYFELNPVALDSYSLEIPSATNRTHLEDAPYDMFAIPYGNLYYNAAQPQTLMDADMGMRLATAIQLNLGSSLYDIQLLPYAPFADNMFVETDDKNMIVFARNNFVPLSKDGKVVSCMIWCLNSSLTKYLEHSIQVSPNNIEFKVQNECDMYRLSSPNYNSGFEFSATKNGGVLRFRADIAYKPITPYIRVAPLFNNLYGKVVDDARGLICGGDFSLSQVIDKWLEYQRTNKNFQDIFDRQIENMEFNNNIARIQERVGVATGTVSAVGTGVISGGMAGGGVGAAIGGVVAGGASLGGGIADVYFNEKLRNEALDYTKDQFGYQLGNIKALPTGLAKVSALNPNNKIFPILEYYTATDIEKEALRNKIKYNGMTVMRIGTIADFIQAEPSYIKGQVIRNTDIDSDYEYLKALANELNKGVFI